MILIINTCQHKLSENEFVLPIIRLLNSKDLEYKVVKYDSLTNDDFTQADRIIISGTAMHDFDYNSHLDKFKPLLDCNKPILGICAGFQIICQTFGCKSMSDEVIGVHEIEVESNPLARSNKIKIYLIHNDSIDFSKDCEFNYLAKVNETPCFIKHVFKEIYACAFHPEVYNEEIILNFATRVYIQK